MYVTMYVYTNELPGIEMTLFRCLYCGRGLFKANADNVVIANTYGMSHTVYEPGSVYIEHQCHSCKAMYKILFK